MGLSKVKRIDTILVVVDKLSKYGHFMTLRHPFTAKEVVVIFIKDVVRLHKFPQSIVIDRDRVFMSGFCKELFKAVGTSLKFSSAYHPKTDGQPKVVNKNSKTYL